MFSLVPNSTDKRFVITKPQLHCSERWGGGEWKKITEMQETVKAKRLPKWVSVLVLPCSSRWGWSIPGAAARLTVTQSLKSKFLEFHVQGEKRRSCGFAVCGLWRRGKGEGWKEEFLVISDSVAYMQLLQEPPLWERKGFHTGICRGISDKSPEGKQSWLVTYF